MIYYIESRNTDPYWNLAFEQFVFDSLPKEDSYFMLWQNHNSIIIGKHQNTQEEINPSFVKEHNIKVARRLSGGGAVYHDMGNLNFTFVSDAEKPGGIDFSTFCSPIQKVLCSLGVPVEISGRNDMTVEGKKFSGNAQYIKHGRILHHGTILYDSDLSVLSKALNPGSSKIESRGIKSVQSRVTNIRPYMKTDMPINDFWAALKNQISSGFGMEDFLLSREHNGSVEDLRKIYSDWKWNYGSSPPHTLRKERRIEGCGKVEVFLDIAREGKISGIAFYGDFFSSRDPEELEKIFEGRNFEYNEIKMLLAEMQINEYFHGLDMDSFLALLFN